MELFAVLQDFIYLFIYLFQDISQNPQGCSEEPWF